MKRAIKSRALVVSCPCSSGAFGEVVLVKDGGAASAIVLGEHDGESARLAARELQVHLREASGAEIPVVPESQAQNLPAGVAKVVIGAGPLAETLGVSADGLQREEFLVKTVGPDLVICARDEDGGPLERQSPAHAWAVYDLLDRKLGVRWLWPGEMGTVVPEKKTITIGPVDVRFRPPVPAREIRGGDATWKRRHGATGARVTYQFGDAGLLHFGGPDTHLWDKYSETKPGMFAEDVDGRRDSLAGYFGKNSVELCFSHPEVIAVLIAEWEARGAPRVVNACQADSAVYCSCAQCLTLDERLSGVKRTKEEFRTQRPNLSDRYVWFWNRLIARMRQKNPEAVICVQFYEACAEPPLSQKLQPGIMGRIVGRIEAADWHRWRDAGAESIVLRPNWWHVGACGPYLPLVREGHYLVTAASGMAGMDYDSLQGFWATQGSRYYLTARRVLRPDLSPEQILDEYAAAFGAAAPAIRRYLDYWIHHSETVVPRGNEVGGVGGASGALWRELGTHYPPAAMAPAYRILAEADAQAATDALTRHRIDFLRDGLHQVEVTIRVIESKGEKVAELKQFRREMTEKYGFWGSDGVAELQDYAIVTSGNRS